jgi:uncharacterized protein YndB with AHSA1/START domain
MEDQIEQEITINASLDRVWDLVTQPGWWVPSDNEQPVDRTPGSQTIRESAKYGRFPVETVQLDPQSYAAFRWASEFPGQELAEGKTTLIEFFLAPLAEAVKVTVRESGFAALEAPAEARQTAFEANTGGWRLELGELKSRAEATADAAPAG